MSKNKINNLMFLDGDRARTDVMIFLNIFAKKISENIGCFFAHTTARFFFAKN
jgi:hypothetical protein